MPRAPFQPSSVKSVPWQKLILVSLSRPSDSGLDFNGDKRPPRPPIWGIFEYDRFMRPYNLRTVAARKPGGTTQPGGIGGRIINWFADKSPPGRLCCKSILSISARNIDS